MKAVRRLFVIPCPARTGMTMSAPTSRTPMIRMARVMVAAASTASPKLTQSTLMPETRASESSNEVCASSVKNAVTPMTTKNASPTRSQRSSSVMVRMEPNRKLSRSTLKPRAALMTTTAAASDE